MADTNDLLGGMNYWLNIHKLMDDTTTEEFMLMSMARDVITNQKKIFLREALEVITQCYIPVGAEIPAGDPVLDIDDVENHLREHFGVKDEEKS